MRKLIEYNHPSIDGMVSGDAWNAERLTGDTVEAVARLKQDGDGTSIKYGNGPFGRAWSRPRSLTRCI